MDNPKILDNTTSEFQLKNFITKLLISNKYSQVSIATGYWDLLGMHELLPAFDHFLNGRDAAEVRFLIGEEPKVRINQIDTAFPEKFIKDDLRDLPFKPEYQEVVKFLSKQLDDGRIKVKLYNMQNSFIIILLI